MTDLQYTLLADGSADEALLPIIDWVLINAGVNLAIQGSVADLRPLRNPPRDLPSRIAVALDLFPCDILFIHRDAERSSRDSRIREIRRALASPQLATLPTPAVCVVPVRASEAWLLFNEASIRFGAGNPNGTIRLRVPALSRLELLPRPKVTLASLLITASQLPRRRLRRFPTGLHLRRIAQFIDDFAPLRRLPAFRAFEADLRATVANNAW